MLSTTDFSSYNEVEQKLLSLPVPQQTESYTPIPHSLMIEKTTDEIKKRGLVIKTKSFKIHGEGQGVIGYYGIESKEDDKLGMMIGFRNSYDKSMAAGYVTGAQVWICKNGIISGDVKIIRKHTGKADEEVASKLMTCLDSLESVFRKIKEDADKLKSLSVSKKVMSELLGRMFIESEMITSTQLNVIKKEIAKPTFIYSEKGETWWDFYNFVTFSLKSSAPISAFSDHSRVHSFVMNEYDIHKSLRYA